VEIAKVASLKCEGWRDKYCGHDSSIMEDDEEDTD